MLIRVALQILEDVSFHPCVRLAAFDRDRVVSFVPPDGEFKVLLRFGRDVIASPPICCTCVCSQLLDYRAPEMIHNAPLYLRPQVRCIPR